MSVYSYDPCAYPCRRVKVNYPQPQNGPLSQLLLYIRAEYSSRQEPDIVALYRKLACPMPSDAGLRTAIWPTRISGQQHFQNYVSSLKLSFGNLLWASSLPGTSSNLEPSCQCIFIFILQGLYAQVIFVRFNITIYRPVSSNFRTWT